MTSAHKISFTLLLGLLLVACSLQKNKKAPLDIAETQLKNQVGKLLSNSPIMYPRAVEHGTVRLVPPRDWTSGFFAGCLWYMYEHTQDKYWKEQAHKFTIGLESMKTFKGTHDLGFIFYCSYGNAYRLTQDKQYAEVLVEASNSLLSRYNPNVKSIRSWDFGEWQFPVIIDNMMNLEMLFWASKYTGNSIYKEIAIHHANTTLKNHFRPDFSCYHVVNYDTISGEVISKGTHQGFSDESAWARGQGWALYGYTMCYRETNNDEYLKQAENVAQYIIKQLPTDLIPFWDFNDPSIPQAPRDASAAALYASAFIELASFTKEKQNKNLYISVAQKIIEQLSSDSYLSKENENHYFILKHSTGNKPFGGEVDEPIIYADYYFLEALLRQTSLK